VCGRCHALGFLKIVRVYLPWENALAYFALALMTTKKFNDVKTWRRSREFNAFDGSSLRTTEKTDERFRPAIDSHDLTKICRLTRTQIVQVNIDINVSHLARILGLVLPGVVETAALELTKRDLEASRIRLRPFREAIIGLYQI